MIKFENASFHYENGDEHASVIDVSLNIKQGEVVLLCGESGCGKTTLTRLINGLIPHYHNGELSGDVLINGKSIRNIPLYETAKYVGSVFQNPRSQFFNIDTNSEIVFGCENQGLPAEEIENRFQHTVEHLHIEPLLRRSIFDLSGGEKQKIACGCVHAANPDIIVLDEPSSNLDEKATQDLAGILAHWKSEGKTIVIAEHRLYYLAGIADRMIFMRDGKIEREFTMEEAKRMSGAEMSELGLRPLSRTVLLKKAETNNGGARPIKLSGFRYNYKNGVHALNIDSLDLPGEQIIAVIGKNGAGKSTFARGLCGLLKKFKGSTLSGGKIYSKKKLIKNAYMVMQDVNHQLFSENVLDEVLLSMSVGETEKAAAILDSLNLCQLKDRHPMSLSGGQKQRVAIASAIASERDIIIFDEPTSGLDLRHMEQVSQCIKKLKDMGKTVIIISHDFEFIANTCEFVFQFESGCAVSAYSLDI